MMMNLPKDPVMLLSCVNMKLRDCYPSMEELCLAMGVSKDEIDEALGKIDYVYDAECNQYV